MMWHRIAGIALVLPLAVGSWNVLAQNQTKQHDRLQMLAAKLGLSDQQKEEVRKICTDFDPKVSKVDHQLWQLVDQERAAILNVLNDSQRSKVPAVMKEEREKELKKIASKLGFNDTELQKIREVCEQFEPKFQALIKQQGQDVHQKLHELRHEAFAAIRQVVTEDQRAKLPGVLREEIHAWHNQETRSEHLKAIGDKLGLTDDQRNQVKQVMTSFSTKLEQPRNELRQLIRDEHTQIEKVLTEQQRTKMRDFIKTHNGG